MSRILTVGAAQLGPIQRNESRSICRRADDHACMRQAKGHGCDLVVFPEAALTAFFPHWWMDDEAEIDTYFESAMPNNATAPLFAVAKELGIGFHLGYCELAHEGGRKRRFNTAILVDKVRHDRRQVPQDPSARTSRITSRPTRSRTSRNATSRPATSAGRCGTPWAATSG